MSAAALSLRWSRWRRAFVDGVYATHNRSPAVRRALAPLLAGLDAPGARGLDLGSGGGRLHPRVVAFDLDRSERPGCQGSALELPFRDEAFTLVVSQEVFEHLPDPWQAAREAARTLAPGGRLYLQTPFVIGRHDGPRDYWRFTRDGLAELIRRTPGLVIEDSGVAVGGGTGAYRIAVELVAGLAGAAWSRLYHPAKGLAAAALFPLKALDRWLDRDPERERIAGGYYVIARKADRPPVDRSAARRSTET